MSTLLVICILWLFIESGVDGQNANGEIVFQEALRWNYTYMNPTCTSAGGGRNPCQDIRICTFAAASLAIGGWPTLCGWVGKGVPKVCCGLPLVLGQGLMKKVDEELSRKKACGTTTYSSETEITRRLFEIKDSLPKVDISDPNKFDPPLDLEVQPMLIPPAVYTGSRQGLFPWMVSIRQDTSHLCGGSLIDRQHILTTASCVFDDKNNYTVHVGNLYADDGYEFQVSKISIHPQYEEFGNFKNLAIVELSEEILSPKIAHICLPDAADGNVEGLTSTLLQWGQIVENNKTRQYLNVIDDLTIVPVENCQRNYEKCTNEIIPEFNEDLICIETTGESGDEFEEDVGGPLMNRNSIGDNRQVPWTILAVDTFGSACGNTPVSRLLTSVSGHLDWIKQILNE